MIVDIVRLISDSEATLGALQINGTHYGYTLEDQKQITKVADETRIPSGNYKVGYRTVGRLHNKYKKMFPLMHKGMIHLLDVPNFKYIYFHIGNTDDDTSGCILVGAKAILADKIMIRESTFMYKFLYEKISQTLDRGEPVYVSIVDKDIIL